MKISRARHTRMMTSSTTPAAARSSHRHTALRFSEFVPDYSSMRLTPNQHAAILAAVGRKDPDARIILFGSRADDRARGGDIDLLVVSDRIGLHQEWEIRRDILDQIGWQKLDLIVRRGDQLDSPIAGIAMETGIPL
jgi:predicted nucleotidyltransferase